jgi:uncharacterized protein YegL
MHVAHGLTPFRFFYFNIGLQDKKFCRKKDKAMQPHYLLVNILDASGSMGRLQEATIAGYNQYLQSQEGKGVNLVYTVTFSNKTAVIRELDTLSSGLITNRDYQPNGGTALYDAIGETVNRIDKLLNTLSTNWKVIVNIITDGEENSSRYFSEVDIQQLIEDHQNKGWLFIYAGAHNQAKQEAKKMRIKPENVVEVKADQRGIQDSFAAFENQSRLFKKIK